MRGGVEGGVEWVGGLVMVEQGRGGGERGEEGVQLTQGGGGGGG